MQIPILNGIYANSVDADFRTAYPRNLVPIPKDNGIAKGYLRPADGIVKFGDGPGLDRGGFNWNGMLFRVMGSKLVSIDEAGTCTTLGDVGSGGQASFDNSFDYLAVGSSGSLFLWNGLKLTQITDPDLGYVKDFIWVDGYFMSTDGTYLIVTELNDPTSVNPLKYGSSEADPDPIMALLKLRDEVYALNRYTIEVFQDVGGTNFPFQRVPGAQIMRGAIGTHAVAVFMEAVAFLGGRRNEAPAVWLGINGSSQKLSTREIDQSIGQYTEDQLSRTVLETRVVGGQQLLYIHLPDLTWVYDYEASKASGESIWYKLTSSLQGEGLYRARNFIWCYNKWIVGDPQAPRTGYISTTISSHYGEINGWDFMTSILYNSGAGAIFHQLELIGLSGAVALGNNATIWTSYSLDGSTWSQERPRSAGKIGERLRRITWLQQGNMRRFRIQKFRGNSDAHLSIARLEAQIEALNV